MGAPEGNKAVMWSATTLLESLRLRCFSVCRFIVPRFRSQSRTDIRSDRREGVMNLLVRSYRIRQTLPAIL